MVYVNAYEELTYEDKNCLLNFVKAQNSDGCEEENFDYIYDKKIKNRRKKLYIIFFSFCGVVETGA